MKAEEFWIEFKKLFRKGSDSLESAQKNWDCERDFTNEFINKKIPQIMSNCGKYKTEFENLSIENGVFTPSFKHQGQYIDHIIGQKGTFDVIKHAPVENGERPLTDHGVVFADIKILD